MNPAVIQDLFEYSFWAFDLIWPSIHRLDDEQFVRDLGYSFGSIRNQMIHLISSHRRWLCRLKGVEVPEHLNFDAFPNRSTAKMEWDDTRASTLEYVYTLDQTALDAFIHYQIPGRSIDTSHKRWQILMQLVNHSTDHRAQLLAMLNMVFDVETPEHDFILYLWEKGRAGLETS